jgi:hypothetical protein
MQKENHKGLTFHKIIYQNFEHIMRTKTTLAKWVAVDLYVFCLAGETSKEKKFKIEKSKTGMDKSFSNSKITKYRIQTTIHWLLSVPKRTHGNNR